MKKFRFGKPPCPIQGKRDACVKSAPGGVVSQPARVTPPAARADTPKAGLRRIDLHLGATGILAVIVPDDLRDPDAYDFIRTLCQYCVLCRPVLAHHWDVFAVFCSKEYEEAALAAPPVRPFNTRSIFI
jgi:hypothetical protein